MKNKEKKIISVIVGTVLLLSACGCSSSKYDEAIDLMKSEKYDEAKVIFAELGDYKDSKELLTECNENIAFELLQGGWYLDSELIFRMFYFVGNSYSHKSIIGDYEETESGRFEIKGNEIITDSMGTMEYEIRNGELILDVAEDGTSLWKYYEE